MMWSALIVVVVAAGAAAAPQRPVPIGQARPQFLPQGPLGPVPIGPLGPEPQRPIGPFAPRLLPGQGNPQEIPIIQQNSVINPDGSYQYNYETANGIKADEQGGLKNAGNPELESLSVQGQFSYISDDGTPIQVTYIADENGFQPQGAHLPTPPPIPEEILRSLEYNAAHPEEDDDGQPQIPPGVRRPLPLPPVGARLPGGLPPLGKK